MKPPSDLKILRTIYKMYYKDFESFNVAGKKTRETKGYVPIDCKRVAKKLRVDPDIVFGRLYYHLENKHGYKQPDGSKVHFFSRQVGKDEKCVNFPMLASVLAGLQADHSKFLWSLGLSITAITISLVSLYIRK